MMVDPRAGAALAVLRCSDLALTSLRPMPVVVAVMGLAPPAATAMITALLAQALNALAPGRVVVVDADGVGQLMRDALGAGSNGDLLQLAQTVRPGSPRRAVDGWLDFGGSVPLGTAAGTDPRHAVDVADLAAALQLLRRRFTAVLVHLPAGSPADQAWWAGSTADRVVFVPDEHADLTVVRDWWRDLRPSDSGLVLADVRLANVGSGRIGDLDLGATAALARALARVTDGWRG